MQTWQVHSSEGLVLRQDLAGAGSRMIAGLVDLALQVTALLLLIIGVAGGASLIPQFLSAATDFALGILMGGILLSPVLYSLLFELAWDGQTPGKRLLGLRVRDLDGAAPGFGKLLLRALFRPLDILLLVPLPIGLILVAVLPLGQRLGDLAAGTIVIRENRSRPILRATPGQRWSQMPQRQLKLEPALAARFSARDVAFLRALLDRGEEAGRRELSEEARRRLYVETARALGARIGVHEFQDARLVLEELAAFLDEHGPGAR
jgi:uncharacterized RDD family membrane protein YckC